MKKLAILLLLCASPLLAQHQKAMDIIRCNVDSSYFDEQGMRWFEFTLPVMRGYRVVDLFAADTVLRDFDVVRGNKEYLAYIKTNNITQVKKYDKKVIAHLSGYVEDAYLVLWMYENYAFGMFAISTTN